MSNLTPKQRRFVEEYLKDLNGTQAAIRAGYSAKTANEQSSQLLAKLNVKEAVQLRMDKRSKRVEITADYVLGTIQSTVETCKDIGEHPAVLKGCELLGRHLKLFTDKVEHSGKFTLEDLVVDDSEESK